MRTMIAALAACLSACGGGGPDPRSTPQSCQDSVRIQLYGDSTQVGAYDDGFLQDELDARYAGRVKLILQAVSGTRSTQLMAGTDGLNAPWPASVTADIAMVNHGINDQGWSVPMETYAADLRAFAHGPARMVLETPKPIGVADMAPWAAVGRQAATEAGIPVADVFAYVMSLPNWEGMLLDGIHPSPELQQAIAQNVTAPTLEPVIDSLLCR